jgi:hypothetical protein
MEETYTGMLLVYPGSGKLRYETPAVTTSEIKLECSIAAGSSRLIDTTGDFQIEDYSEGGNTELNNINLM